MNIPKIPLTNIYYFDIILVEVCETFTNLIIMSITAGESILALYKYLAAFCFGGFMQEVWKDVKGYEGLYQVSNYGRVKSLERSVNNNKNGGKRKLPERIIVPTDNGNGYKIVGLHKERKRKNFYLHRLVAEHFLLNPQNKKYINHLDYDTSNNTVTNLEWCTQKENVAYSVSHMKKPRKKYKPTNTGEKYISKKISRNKTYYVVNIATKGICKYFKCLNDAINYRNGVVEVG